MMQATDRIELQGRSVSSGKVHSKICLYSYKNYQQAALRIRQIDLIPSEEIKRFEQAIIHCDKELHEIKNRIVQNIGIAEAAVLDAQSAILNDITIISEIKKNIETDKVPFENAAEKVFTRFEEMFMVLEDDFFKERSTDIGEVKRRLLNFGYKTEPGFVCSGQRACGKGYKSIIVAEELTAAMLLEIDLSKVLGIVTERGGVNGHAALLARAAAIPAVTGIIGALDFARCGGTILIDGTEGVVVFNPTISETRLIEEQTSEAIVEVSLPGIEVYANCGTLESVDIAVQKGADGIGLFRTELLFLNKGKMLSEAEQIDYYVAICQKMGDKRVTFRLLDIGGDKSFPFLPQSKEDNPFLGFRGSRYLLGNREILRTQIRAILHTAQKFPLKIMLPMVVDLHQLEELLSEIEMLATDTKTDREQFEIGVMFEVPSALFQAEQLLSKCDFGSIGSNDLLQYLFAIDRNNELVASEYDMGHPVLWQAMQMIVDAGKKVNRPITICGELASYPEYAERLFSIGIQRVSVSPHLISPIRSVLNQSISAH